MLMRESATRCAYEAFHPPFVQSLHAGRSGTAEFPRTTTLGHKLVLDLLCDSWGGWLAKPHTLVVPREGFMCTLTPEHFDPCWLSRCM